MTWVCARRAEATQGPRGRRAGLRSLALEIVTALVLTPRGLRDVTLEPVASVRAPCALSQPRHSAYGGAGAGTARSLGHGFELTHIASVLVGRESSTQAPSGDAGSRRASDSCPTRFVFNGFKRSRVIRSARFLVENLPQLNGERGEPLGARAPARVDPKKGRAQRGNDSGVYSSKPRQR
jgi:hypothetical protein